MVVSENIEARQLVLQVFLFSILFGSTKGDIPSHPKMIPLTGNHQCLLNFGGTPCVDKCISMRLGNSKLWAEARAWLVHPSHQVFVILPNLAVSAWLSP